MKQKVVSKAIIKRDNQVLLLRRRGGRPSIRGFYELPGGKINKKEQPEDALVAGLKIHIGLKPTSFQLVDVITFIDPDDRELQYIFIIFEATIVNDSDIVLSDEYDKYVWAEPSSVQPGTITESTKQILRIKKLPLVDSGRKTKMDKIVDKITTELIGYSDGGSRGNPGPAAAGFILIDRDDRVVAEGGKYLGIASNPIAECTAVQLALEGALKIGAKELFMRLDSRTVVDLLNNSSPPVETPKETEAIYKKIKTLASRFSKVTFSHVGREQNTLADGIVNKILDQKEPDSL